MPTPPFLPVRPQPKLKLPRQSFGDIQRAEERIVIPGPSPYPANWNALAISIICVAMAYQLYEDGPFSQNPPNFNPIYIPEDEEAVSFGFTATYADRFNILALRGTSDTEEAVYDGWDWNDYTTCTLPTVPNKTTSNCGQVNASLYDFYTEDDLTTDSLATSCQGAIAATQSKADLPWLACAHSLGGAMLSLAVLDGILASSFGKQDVQAITFASTYVGDATFASTYNGKCPATTRVANLCDWVPSFIGFTPGPATDPFVHVGQLQSFVWQSGSDWGNHQLDGTYWDTIFQYPEALKMGNRTYPF